MRYLDGEWVYTATDLCDFLACEHLTQLEKRAACGEDLPRNSSALSEVLRTLGAGHERAYLARLEGELAASGKRLKKFDPGLSLDAPGLTALRTAAAETEAAMQEGFDVIYQPAFFDGRWFGRADFLFRVETESALGPFGYELADAKLARRVRAEALLQLCEYSTHVERIQGRPAARMHVILGDLSEHAYVVAEFSAYHAAVKDRFEASVRDRAGHTYPLPVSHCKVCEFAALCVQQRRQDDHLSLVARIRGDQIRKLETSGVTTLTALAAGELGPAPRRMSQRSYLSLRDQARLQHAGANPDGTPRFELLDVTTPGNGLCALPVPSRHDLFFDIEGDNLARDEPLEYLFGVVEVVDGQPAYQPFWGHDAAREKRAFEQLVDHAVARLDADPGMHIYHYGDYERVALQRLMGRHATREEEVDRLLRGGVLVDLYRTVRQGLRLSTESYGLKAVERLYAPVRTETVADGTGSMVVYERWLAGGAHEPDRDQRLLDDIAAYNRADCVSAMALRDWLETQRSVEEARRDSPLPRPERTAAAPSDALRAAAEETQALREALLAGIPDDATARDEGQRATWLLAQLLDFHRRENRVEWWSYFRHLEMTAEELDADNEALGPLEYAGVADTIRSSHVHRYTFEPQEHRIKRGEEPIDPATGGSAGKVHDVDTLGGWITLTRGARSTKEHPRFLIAPKPFLTNEQRGALVALAQWVSAHGIDAPGPYGAARDLLQRRRPRLLDHSHTAGTPLRRAGEPATDSLTRLAINLDAGCLPVQGPPGSGKTYTVARAILELCRDRPVAVTATTHKAITRLLEEIVDAARDSGQSAPRVWQRAESGKASGSPAIQVAAGNEVIDDALDAGLADVVGGTAWLFAREKIAGRFGTIVVDEAGQMSLADVVAISRAARNLVLVGDPRQLAHVVHGSHPDGAELSAMEHLLGNEVTIAADRGLFLDHSWRMHPDVCAFVSDTFYEGRLAAEPACRRQAILGPDGALTGLRVSPVLHTGDRTSSGAEAQRVNEIVEELLRCTWHDREGTERPLTLEDILVVTPYNAHAALLANTLRSGARIGTVDRFQGQQAAVVIFSMATSSVDDLPRHLEFLYSLNRLNVAVSRARCLCVLVLSPALLNARCHTPDQMRLVNALCRYARAASTAFASADPEDAPADPAPVQGILL